jgi:hypothetical protein
MPLAPALLGESVVLARSRPRCRRSFAHLAAGQSKAVSSGKEFFERSSMLALEKINEDIGHGLRIGDYACGVRHHANFSSDAWNPREPLRGLDLKGNQAMLALVTCFMTRLNSTSAM